MAGAAAPAARLLLRNSRLLNQSTMKHFSRIVFATSFALGLATFTRAAVETYKIDPVHSSVGFSIRHFFSNVPGVFTKFSGTIVVDRDNLENSTVEALSLIHI